MWHTEGRLSESNAPLQPVCAWCKGIQQRRNYVDSLRSAASTFVIPCQAGPQLAKKKILKGGVWLSI